MKKEVLAYLRKILFILKQKITKGILQYECSTLLTDFLKKRNLKEK